MRACTLLSVAMARSQHLIVLVGLLLSLPVESVNYINDELLWTKQSWNEYKMDFPWKFFSKREPAVARLLDSDDFVKSSLNGPLGNIQSEIDNDIKRGIDVQPSRFDVSLLDESSSLEAAAGVAQCKVCMSLASAMWSGLTTWVSAHEAVPSKRRIKEYAEQLCDLEVVNDVLSDWVLLRAKVQPNQLAPFFIEGNKEFYMLSERQKQHATPAEIQAVRLSCKKLLKEDPGEGSKTPGIVRLTSGLLHKYYDHLEERLLKANGRGGAVEAVDDGPRAEQACVDRHPQCLKWAVKGECEKNPTYMVGDDAKYIGQCKRSCGACHPTITTDPQPTWSEADLEFMSTVSMELLMVLHSKACTGGTPCAGAAGAGMEQLLEMAGGKREGGVGGKVVGGGFISGPLPVPGEEQQARPLVGVDSERLQHSRVLVIREAADALLGGPSKTSPAMHPASQLPTAAAKELWALLGQRCLYTTAGWWSYELCYMDAIMQFHMTEANEVDWTISLGHYDSADWELRNTTRAALFPPRTQVPFVSQLYTQGNDCELTEDTPGEGEVEEGRQQQQQQGSGSGRSSDGSGGGVPVIKRVTELRLMCSPDSSMRLEVTEPRQCRYLVELYVPQLCRMEGFRVEEHELGWGEAD